MTTLLLAAVFVALGVWAWIHLGPTPAADRDWDPEHSVPPRFRIDGPRVTVEGVRNFSWVGAGDYVPAWENRTYDLGELRRVWFVLTPFSTRWRGPAHTFLSFQFGDDDFLAVSVEARRERGESYGVVKGMLRRFELIYVAGDERDLVGVRALHRSDDVYVYPARVDADAARALFLQIAHSANRLHAEPEFYHSVTNNCTTRIVNHVNRVAPARIPRSWRILLPGHADRLALDLGLLDTDLPIEAARERWFVNERARAWADDPGFSLGIRGEEETPREGRF